MARFPCPVDDGSKSEYEFTTSLRLRHPGIDPARITHTFALEPQHSCKVGNPRRDPPGAALEAVAELHISPFARTDFRLDLSVQSLALLGHLGLAVALDVHPQPAPAVRDPQAI